MVLFLTFLSDQSHLGSAGRHCCGGDVSTCYLPDGSGRRRAGELSTGGSILGNPAADVRFKPKGGRQPCPGYTSKQIKGTALSS
jgi:hypothetical protein